MPKYALLPDLPETGDRKLDMVLSILTELAIAKKRCPSNNAPGYEWSRLFREKTGEGFPDHALHLLARLGTIRIEVQGKNWRVVEILTGRYKGARTMEDPDAGHLYRIVDATGSHMLPREKPRKKPWTPGSAR